MGLRLASPLVSGSDVIRVESPDGRTPLVFAWDVSSFSGVGVYGLNLALALAANGRFSPIAAIEFSAADLVLDPLREHVMRSIGALSSALWPRLACASQRETCIDAPLLVGLGSDLMPTGFAGGKVPTGRPPVGVAFTEQAALSEAGRQRADRFALIVAGSSWNETILRANGIVATTTVMQGVDTSLFHPAPKTGHYRDRFVIFSGGLLAHRNAQDLVVKAFQAFHQRHAEALLLTAWHTPWHQHAYFPFPDIVPANRTEDGWVDTAAWAIANGVPADALIALGRVPNIAMPHVIREAAVAVFPNRCEPGTNPVAMECMACGIPTILSANTGHLDLLRRDDVSYRLTRQGDALIPEWRESDVDEIVEALEAVWRDRAAAAAIGQRGSALAGAMTWQRQTELLLRAIDPLLP